MLQFLEWHAKWWMDRTGAIVTTNKTFSEGCCAYAECQAELQDHVTTSSSRRSGDGTENGSEVRGILTTAHQEFSGCAHRCVGKPKRREQD